jgi:flavin-binding protein dodecin
MSDSVYRVTEVIGVSSESWEAAARNAVETAAQTVRDLRVAEVIRTDVTIENGTIASYQPSRNLVQIRVRRVRGGVRPRALTAGGSAGV